MKIRKIKGTAILNGNVVDSLEENSTTNAPSQRAVNDGIKVLGKASKNLFNSRTAVSTSKITVLDNKNGVVELRGVSTYWNTLKVPIYLTKNTTYTIRSEYTKADDGAPLIDILDDNNNAIRENYYATDNTLGGKFTTNSELNYIVFRCNGATNTGYVKYLNVQLEEGSTATEYEDYCEPSILVKDSNGHLHEIPYVTGKASKNLFNMLDSSRFVFREKSNTYQSFKLSTYSANEIKVTGGNGNYTEGFIDVSGLKPNTPYKVSYKIKENTLGFNPGMWINGDSSDTGTLTITVGLNNGSTSVSSSNYVIFTDIQLEEGAVITSYEEPFGPIISVKDSKGNNHDLPVESSQYINTDGAPTKTGRVIDGKFEYVKRIVLNNFPDNGVNKTWATGLNMTNIVITDLKVMVLSGSGNWFTLPNNDTVNTKVSVLKDGNIQITCFQVNLKGCNGYGEITYYHTS